MHLSQTFKLLVGLAALAVSAVVGVPAAVAESGTTVIPSPTQKTLVVRQFGKTGLRFVSLETGAVLGTYDPEFAVRSITFSRSERFICLANNLVVPNSIVLVLDRERHFRPVLKIAVHAANCAYLNGLTFRSPSLGMNSRASNLIELYDYRSSGPGNCREVTSDQYWDLRGKTPKLFKHFDSVYDACP